MIPKAEADAAAVAKLLLSYCWGFPLYLTHTRVLSHTWIYTRPDSLSAFHPSHVLL